MSGSASRTRTLYVELGSGCGLVSLATACMLARQHLTSKEVITTDLPEVVDTTLSETLAANPALSKLITTQALRWGQSQVDLPVDIQQHDGDLVILASDVLYNAHSHRDFLTTLLGMFESSKHHCEALLTYKHRVEGDDGFFQMANQAGLCSEMIHKVADIEIWRCLAGHSM